jgi:hypothetical protein
MARDQSLKKSNTRVPQTLATKLGFIYQQVFSSQKTARTRLRPHTNQPHYIMEGKPLSYPCPPKALKKLDLVLPGPVVPDQDPRHLNLGNAQTGITGGR